DRGHLDLAGQEDVLLRLRHRAVGSRDHEDRAVHLRGARDHVLDVVGVARAVDVRVVAVRPLVLPVRGGGRGGPLPLLRRLVDLVEGDRLAAARLSEDLRDRRRQRGLAVVDVTDRADVDVRLGAIELLLAHWWLPALLTRFLFRSGVDDVARDRLRYFLVTIELHGEVGPA